MCEVNVLGGCERKWKTRKTGNGFNVPHGELSGATTPFSPKSEHGPDRLHANFPGVSAAIWQVSSVWEIPRAFSGMSVTGVEMAEARIASVGF
jgi:hypothetical protein